VSYAVLAHPVLVGRPPGLGRASVPLPDARGLT